MFLRDLQKKFGGECVGEVVHPLSGVGSIERASPTDITFLANPKYRAALATSHAGAVIIGPIDHNITDKPKLLVKNPYAVFAQVAQLFSPPSTFAAGIHANAVVGIGTKIAASAKVLRFFILCIHTELRGMASTPHAGNGSPSS